MDLDNITACDLFHNTEKITNYIDRRSNINEQEYIERLKGTHTLYLGNLNNFTNDNKMYQLLRSIGPLKLFKIGVHKRNFEKEGYYFAEYYDRNDTETAKYTFGNTVIDGSKINIDYDLGYQEGRQYGRGFHGGTKETEKAHKHQYISANLVRSDYKIQPFKNKKIQKQ